MPNEQQRPNEEQRRNGLYAQLTQDRPRSFPEAQFEEEVFGECQQIWKERYPRPCPKLWIPDESFTDPATETVKKRWIEQGIWKDEWSNKNKPAGRWKHEEPLELESESETDSEAEYQPPSVFLGIPKRPKPRRRKADEEIRKIAERRPVREREREASRPYHQFLWQVSRERERIQGEQGVGNVTAEDSATVNSRAYERIKNKWTKRGVWYYKWGVLPGMWWKHERPFEELLQELVADDPVLARANNPENRGRIAAAPPAAPPVLRGLFDDLRPIEPGHNRSPEPPTANDPLLGRANNPRNRGDVAAPPRLFDNPQSILWPELPPGNHPMLDQVHIPRNRGDVAAPPVPRGLFDNPQPIEPGHNRSPEPPMAHNSSRPQNSDGDPPAPAPRPQHPAHHGSSDAPVNPSKDSGRPQNSNGDPPSPAPRPQHPAHHGSSDAPVNPSKASKRKRAPEGEQSENASGEPSPDATMPRRSKRIKEAKPKRAPGVEQPGNASGEPSPDAPMPQRSKHIKKAKPKRAPGVEQPGNASGEPSPDAPMPRRSRRVRR